MHLTRVKVNPGVCGFPTVIKVNKVGKKQFEITIDTGCEKLAGMSGRLKTIDIMQLFRPVTRSGLYETVEECGLHAACPVPVAIFKALEVEAELALPRDVSIQFQKGDEQ